jgi:hypothetical protein
MFEGEILCDPKDKALMSRTRLRPISQQMRIPRRLAGFLAVVMACWVTAICLPYATGYAQQVLRASGSWATPDGRSGIWTAEFATGGQELGGRLEIADLPEVHAGNVQGTLSGDVVTFGILYDSREQAVFTGSIVENQMSGDFTTPEGLGGTWNGTLAPANTPPPIPQ